MRRFSFRDDYSEGACPAILEALAQTNLEQQAAYGADDYSEEARALLRSQLGETEPDIWFVAGGTLANLISISSALRPHEAVLAPTSGHIVGHETGAIEATGHKIISVEATAGKLEPAGLRAALEANARFPHMARPRLVYLSQATELGTVYRRAELEAIAELCREEKLYLMLDGARLGAALAAEGGDLGLETIARLADLFWIGGTKAGALLGEAIVIPNPALREDFDFQLKQRGALLAKGRLLGLQFRELFRDGLYLELARHGNEMAALLSRGIRESGHELLLATETNQVFPILPDTAIEALQRRFDFHLWERSESARSVARLVTSWATPEESVHAFLEALRTL